MMDRLRLRKGFWMAIPFSMLLWIVILLIIF